ncbi:hypothetical protein [Streptomyces sp. NPDC050504]|uniref:hypothetical protein n=1 Tax=Streptomyces sp. NPDC050504 TaxID=3365618 RepID=UPI0037AB386D
MTEPLLAGALAEEATKKSGLIWVRGADGGTARPLWHVWHEGAAWLVGDGPVEQPFPEGLAAGARAEVSVRSKDKGGRVVEWTALVEEPAPRSEAWEAAVAELKGKRLNAPDGEGVVERWAAECRVLRLAPVTAHTELPSGSLAARPVASPATTREPVPDALPRLLFRRKRRR